VRELENTILQAIVMSKNDVLEVENITLNTRHSNQIVSAVKQEIPQFRTIAELEKYHIKRILDEVNWNKLEASHILDITRPTLNAKIEKYSLVRG
jgi:DNA-binding NtrC family response regulator